MSTTDFERLGRLHERDSSCRVGDPAAVDLVIEPAALRQLRAMARSAVLREAGGVLRASQDSDEMITISEAVAVPGDRGPSHYRLNGETALRLAEERPVCGTVHLHHCRDGVVSDTALSAGDLRAAARARRAFGLTRLVAILILKYSNRSVGFDAYIVEAGPLGRDVARPVRSITEGEPNEVDKAITPAHLLQSSLQNLSHAIQHLARLHDDAVLEDPQSVAWNLTHGEHHACLARSELQRAIKHLCTEATDPTTFSAEIEALPQLPSDDSNGAGSEST